MSPPRALSGELTLTRMDQWLAQAPALASAGELDLAGIRRADSAGLAFLLELRRRSGGQLRFRAAPPAITGLAEFFGLATLLGLQ